LLDLFYQEDEELLSESQKMWLTRVNTVIDQNDDVKQMAKDLDKITELVLKEGNDADQYITIIAIEVTKETMDYWYNNYSEWERLLTGNNSKAWSWKEFGKEDAKGAIAGGIGGAISGGLAGAGLGALGGALGGSAANAVGQLTGWW